MDCGPAPLRSASPSASATTSLSSSSVSCFGREPSITSPSARSRSASSRDTGTVNRLARLGLVGVAGGAAAVAYASLWERNAFALRHSEVPVLTPSGPPIRLLHLSDIHMMGRQTRKQAWISDLARL